MFAKINEYLLEFLGIIGLNKQTETGGSMLGIDSLRELALGIGEIASAGAEIAKDGIGLGDLSQLPKVFSAIRHLSNVELASIIPEVKDLDDAEKAIMAEVFKDAFNIENDAIEVTVEEGLALLLDGLQAVMTFIKIGDKKAAA